MVVPPYSGTGYLYPLLYRKVDGTVSDDDVSSFAEGRDDGRNGAEALGVED